MSIFDVNFNTVKITICYNINIIKGKCIKKGGHMNHLKEKIVDLIKREEFNIHEVNMLLDNISKRLHTKKSTDK